MEWLDLIRWLHVLGACVLIGTGAGIAFFMVMAHRSDDPRAVAHTAGVVVVADTLFTATAAVVQPITGLALTWGLGWSLLEGWVVWSLVLYGVIGACWLPVVVIQIRMRDEARASLAAGVGLSERYHRLYRVWFALGVPAFCAIALLLWLMLMRPNLAVPFTR